MFSRVGSTVKFLTPYVYNGVNGLKMMAVHVIDAISIGIKIALPFVAASAFSEEDETNQIIGFVAVGSVIIIPALLDKAKNLLIVPVTANVQRQLTQELHKQTFSKPYSQYASTASGEFAQSITCNYGNVSTFIPKFYGTLVPFLAESVAITTLLGIKYGLPAVFIPSTLLLYGGISVYLEKGYSETRSTTLSIGYRKYGEMLSSNGHYKIAHQFNRVPLELQNVGQILDDSEKLHHKEKITREIIILCNTIISHLGLAAAVVYSGFAYKYGRITITELFMVDYFTYNFTTSLDQLTASLLDLSIGAVDAKKIIGFIKTHSQVEDAIDAHDLILEEPPEIIFSNIQFSYPSKPGEPLSPIVLDQINLRIPPGSAVAFVGQTGAGKSTIAQMLQRFFAPVAGRILINGQDLHEVSRISLHHNIAVVEQSTVFINDNWYNNIAYALENATEQQIVQAARLAGLITETEDAELLRARTTGIEANALSGGEKQRIAIARAILKGGVILILDEATSALDPITEKQIQATLDKLAFGITTIVVTHKLYSLTSVDQVFYLQGGKIIEHGTCEELINAEGAFYQQLKTQLEEQGNRASVQEWLLNTDTDEEMDVHTEDAPVLLRNWKPYHAQAPQLFFRSSSDSEGDPLLPLHIRQGSGYRSFPVN